MPQRYYLTLPDPAKAHGAQPSLAFRAHGADAFAEELQDALRTPALFERWRAMQEEPDEVDPALGAVDPQATVKGTQRGLQIDLVATTSLSGNLLKQRLRWLAGNAWTMNDVTAA